MWISRQAKTAPPGEKAPAEVGQTTLAGDPAAVYVSGERRQVPLTWGLCTAVFALVTLLYGLPAEGAAYGAALAAGGGPPQP